MGDVTYISTRDAAERLAVSQKGIRAAIRRGELPAVKVCGRVRIGPEDFAAWVERGRVAPDVVIDPPPPALRRPGVSTGLRGLLREPDQAA